MIDLVTTTLLSKNPQVIALAMEAVATLDPGMKWALDRKDYSKPTDVKAALMHLADNGGYRLSFDYGLYRYEQGALCPTCLRPMEVILDGPNVRVVASVPYNTKDNTTIRGHIKVWLFTGEGVHKPGASIKLNMVLRLNGKWRAKLDAPEGLALIDTPTAENLPKLLVVKDLTDLLIKRENATRLCRWMFAQMERIVRATDEKPRAMVLLGILLNKRAEEKLPC